MEKKLFTCSNRDMQYRNELICTLHIEKQPVFLIKFSRETCVIMQRFLVLCSILHVYGSRCTPFLSQLVCFSFFFFSKERKLEYARMWNVMRGKDERDGFCMTYFSLMVNFSFLNWWNVKSYLMKIISVSSILYYFIVK